MLPIFLVIRTKLIPQTKKAADNIFGGGGKEIQRELGRGSAREVSGPEFFMLVSFSPTKTVQKEQGLGGGLRSDLGVISLCFFFFFGT